MMLQLFTDSLLILYFTKDFKSPTMDENNSRMRYVL